MKWIYHDVVEEMVRMFCRQQVPDAHDLDDISY